MFAIGVRLLETVPTFNCPLVVKLPTVILPVALNCDRESKLVAALYPNAVAEVLTDGV